MVKTLSRQTITSTSLQLATGVNFGEGRKTSPKKLTCYRCGGRSQGQISASSKKQCVTTAKGESTLFLRIRVEQSTIIHIAKRGPLTYSIASSN